MYRSIFTKYITAFMLIIVVSFIVLASIIGTTMSDYTTGSNNEMLRRSAENIKNYLENGLDDYGSDSLNRYVYYEKDNIIRGISNLAFYSSEMLVTVTDAEGLLLHFAGDAIAIGSDYVNQSVISSVVQNSGVEFDGTLDGFFNKRSLTYGSAIRTNDNKVVGAVFVSVSFNSVNSLTATMIKTIVIACIWVMLAALIAVYFISDRTIRPLKDMSRAARSFASGNFDVRVPVVGNDEIAELATAFNSMAGSLESLEDMRRTFLANVSHDLRTPMTTIGGFIDGIIDGAIPPEKHEYYLKVIASEVRRLSRLVTSLLDIARIQAGERKFTMTPFDICEMGRQILISFEQKIDAKHLNVDFVCDEDRMMVTADRDAIYQIFYNICDNAVKFSREGGEYRVSLTKKDKKVYVSVYNEGQGIAEDEIEYVFDRFYKSDKSRGLDKTGTGLGLFIAKTIIDAHGEEIWVRSEYGNFCEFVFTLSSSVK